MYAFGHAGLTIAAARAADRGADLRWAVLLALAPDVIDKPGSKLWPEFVDHNTRGIGHSFAFSLVVLAALLLWKRRPRPALILWGCYAGHFLLDAMWHGDNPAVLFWPLLGPFPPPVHGHDFSWLTVWYLAGELAGVAVVVKLVRAHRLLERARLTAFLKSGRLA